MTELMTGCHAPLGVSALRGDDPRIIACYSRKSTTEPVSFADSVWFERRLGTNSTALAQELRRSVGQVFWWGAKAPAHDASLQLHFVPAVKQKPLDARWSGERPEAVFVASQQAAEWVAAHASLGTLPMYTAGAQTAQVLQSLVPGARVTAAPGKGFAQALALLKNKSVRLLWVGSADGEARARAVSRGFTAVEFVAVYTNLPVRPQQLSAGKDSLHVVTSAVAAQAFAAWAADAGMERPLVCCFGDSAVEGLQAAGIAVYHASEADDFATLIRELRGDTSLLRERWQLKEH